MAAKIASGARRLIFILSVYMTRAAKYKIAAGGL
jgi:hypothetical protein